ncbi:hypothetical protein OH687_24645 [Burkholderia anthina]|nr:hypothetical protein OH687_24645 [Burkholderia anthina]
MHDMQALWRGSRKRYRASNPEMIRFIRCRLFLHIWQN